MHNNVPRRKKYKYFFIFSLIVALGWAGVALLSSIQVFDSLLMNKVHDVVEKNSIFFFMIRFILYVFIVLKMCFEICKSLGIKYSAKKTQYNKVIFLKIFKILIFIIAFELLVAGNYL